MFIFLLVIFSPQSITVGPKFNTAAECMQVAQAIADNAKKFGTGAGLACISAHIAKGSE